MSFNFFIKSLLFFVTCICEIKFSMNSSWLICVIDLRSAKIVSSSDFEYNKSSRRVPDFAISIAGNMRFSDYDLFRTISMFPVPLNSSNITSSIRLPVSIRAVAKIV